MKKPFGVPDENRKKAKKLFDEEPFSDDGEYGADEAKLGSGVRLKASKDKKDAIAYAMKLLSVRSYTEYGLREKLKKREYSADEIDAAVEYVRGFGYINDARLAQIVAEKAACKLWGRRKIFMYLRSKGFSAEVINGIDFSEIDFKENCQKLAKKYAAKGADKEKIIRALTNAGFSNTEIHFALFPAF